MAKTEDAKRAVRVWLAERGKTQGWLAKRMRVHYSQLSRVLNGVESSPRVVAALESVTGITLDESETSEVNS